LIQRRTARYKAFRGLAEQAAEPKLLARRRCRLYCSTTIPALHGSVEYGTPTSLKGRIPTTTYRECDLQDQRDVQRNVAAQHRPRLPLPGGRETSRARLIPAEPDSGACTVRQPAAQSRTRGLSGRAPRQQAGQHFGPRHPHRKRELPFDRQSTLFSTVQHAELVAAENDHGIDRRAHTCQPTALSRRGPAASACGSSG